MVLTLEAIPGDTPKHTVAEAMRIACLLDVLVRYTFNDIVVCVSCRGLVYALDKNNVTADWFVDRIPTERRH